LSCVTLEKEELLSEYGKAFSENLYLANLRCRQERDQRISEFESLKAEEADHLLELSKLFPTTGNDMTINRTYHEDSRWQDVHSVACNHSELPPVSGGEESCKTDDTIQKQNRLGTKLLGKRQMSFLNLADLGRCTCDPDSTAQEIRDQKQEPLSKPASARKDFTPEALIAAKAEKGNRGTFKRKEPVVALSKLRLRQPLGLPCQQPSSVEYLTRIRRVSSSRPSSTSREQS